MHPYPSSPASGPVPAAYAAPSGNTAPDSAHLSKSERAVLAGVPARYPVSRIDRVWLFPLRRLRSKESGLLVISVYPAEGEPAGRRLVVTARFEAGAGRAAPPLSETWAEQGWVPVERVGRVISGVLARLGDAAEEPRAAAIGGDATRWAGFTGEEPGPALDRASAE